MAERADMILHLLENTPPLEQRHHEYMLDVGMKTITDVAL